MKKYLFKKMTDSFNNHDFESALKTANEIIKNDSDNFEAIKIKVEILSLPHPRYGKNNEAAAIILKYIENNPYSLQAKCAYASLLNRIGEYKQSEKIYCEIIKIDPNNYDALTGVSSLFDSKGVSISFESAKNYLLKAIDLEPKNYVGYLTISNLLQKANVDPKESLSYLKLSLQYLNADKSIFNKSFIADVIKENISIISHE